MENECLFIDPNMENIHQILNPNQEQEPPLFLDFPSPFFDDNYPIHDTNNYTHITSPTKPTNITKPSDSKQLTKKRSHVGKKDRHSKIHTAQGLRDRRMRLSLHIARKFFDLQDLLGFDKASNTIEWLFCKSSKAIKEVAENFSPQNTSQSMSEENCEVGLISEINANNNSKEEEIKNTRSRKRIQNTSLVRETRDQARARARDRTRERLMIKELEKSNQMFGGNPKQGFCKLGLGHIASPNNHNAEELGFTSSPSEPIHQESSGSGSIVGTSTYCSTLMNQNPPAGWLNSCNGFFPSELDADNFETFYSYGIVPTTVSLTGDIHEQNPSSFHMPSTTNILQ
ncbi:hypothetical protein R6Q59_012222 [Mikania micrantha]|uniref:TCP domain-containing protein n=1 Tax=Mikania micrantha TaxID=192012 RepID=A0A5N6LMR3_9ASTR|nr:hypothetical protein E3N88_40480 [Mikania micrantha]